MKPKKPIIYLPIEVEVRELVSKTLLSMRAAQNGNKVIIGQKSVLNKFLKFFEPGLYISGGAFSNYLPFFKRIVRDGFKILILEEEGLITYKKDMYLDMRTDKDCLNLVDRYYLWGKHQYQMLLSKYSTQKEKFLVTGNPRFDFLTKKNNIIYKKEINLIKNKFKDFCLVCTCFPSINHYDENLNVIENLKARNTLRSKESINNFVKYQEVKRKTLKEFLIFIDQYAKKNTKINIVIRPHPSESNKPYHYLCKKYRNVFLSRDYSVHSWITASKFIVHHYCTTSIEALALDVTSYCIRSESFKNAEYEFPFDCSNCFRSGKEMASSLLKHGIQKKIVDKSKYKKYVMNIDTLNASKQIADDIETFYESDKLLYKNNFNFKIFNSFKRIYVLLLSNLYDLRRSAYERNKLKKIDKKTIKKYINKIDGDGSNKEYKIDYLGKNLLSIEKK